MSNKEFDPNKKQEKIDQNEIDHDKDFLALHEEYQAASTEMPAESTDLNILNAAHSAVNSQHDTANVITPVRVKKVKKHAWYVPVSYVAIIVLSLSVFLKLAFEPEYIDAELNGDDYAEEAFLPETNRPLTSRQFTDKHDKALSEQKIIAENHQQQTAELQKQRMQEAVRQRSKEKAAPKKRLQLKQQAASSSMSRSPQIKQEVVNENVNEYAGAGTEVLPAMALISPPGPELQPEQQPELESDQQAMSDAMPESMSGSGSNTEKVLQSLARTEAIEAGNKQQIKQVNELIKLFETKQLDKLKKALADYRKTYPYNKQTDLLPVDIQEQEKRWQLESEAKSLHN